MIVLRAAVLGVIVVLRAVLRMIVLRRGLLRGGRPAESEQQDGDGECAPAQDAGLRTL